MTPSFEEEFPSPTRMKSIAPFSIATELALAFASYFLAHGVGDRYFREFPWGRVMVKTQTIAGPRIVSFVA